MSGSAQTAANLNPAPERWGAFRAGNTDSRARDTTPDLSIINDTIASASCSIARRDGQAMTGLDLSWTGTVSLDTSLRIVTVMLAAGNPPGLTPSNPIDYTVTIRAVTTGGRILNWDAYQMVVAQIG